MRSRGCWLVGLNLEQHMHFIGLKERIAGRGRVVGPWLGYT
jgi:hypothetical protein